MSDQPWRALIYNRVSADPTGRRISTASQDEENRAFCVEQGWTVVDTITDDARSASRFATRAREGYQRVQEALAGRTLGRIDVVVCWEASRAGRGLDDYVELRRLCAEHNVRLAYKRRVYDLAEGDDRFTTGLDALVAERESEQIRERIRRSHRDSAQRGSPRGIIPYGYRREYDPATGHMTGQSPDPVTSKVVRRIVARVLDGDTLYAIVTDLNRRKVPTPRAYRNQQAGREGTTAGWSTSNLRQMLSKQSLMGVRTHQGLAVGEATWAPIVDPADWARVQAILRDPSRVVTRGVEPAHLLSGIAECAVCGGFLRAYTSRGKATYRCEGKLPTDSKAHVSRLREPLDQFVTRPLLRRMQRRDFLTLLVGPDDDEAVRAAAGELAALQARLAEFEESASAGGLSAPAFGRIEARLLPQIEEARARAVPRTVPAAVSELAGPGAPDVWARWGAEPGGLGKRRAVVRALLRIVVHRTAVRGVRAFDPSTVELSWRGSTAPGLHL